MALATRCPACQTVFRIGTAQAAAKGGAVRCGVCRNVFNSLDALVRVEDLVVVEEVVLQVPVLQVPVSQAAVEPQSVPAAPTERLDPAWPAQAHVPPEQPDMSPPPPVEAQPQTPPSMTAEPPAMPATTDDAATLPDPSETPPIEAETIAVPPPVDAETIAVATPPRPEVADEQAIIREWWMPVEDPVTSGRGDGLDDVGYAAVEADVLAPSKSGRRSETRPEPEAKDGTNPVFMRPVPPEEPSNRAWRLVLGLLSLVAAVALLGQLAYLWRDEVAARWPPARPWLAAACDALRCTVDYPAHADSITIESAAVQSVAANANVYVMTALLRNRDAVDLRYPTLELVLTDFQDRPILRRDFRPADYLAGAPGRTPAAGFAAQSELPVRVTFELDDLRFAGYRLAQFYP